MTLLGQTLSGAKEGVQYVLIEPGRLDFLIVLLGVVVGLSIGRLVSFTGQIINNRDVVSFHPTFIVYLLCLFFYQIYYWWAVWELKENAEEFRDLSFLSYFRLLLMPLFLYGATAVMCKDLHDAEEFSMKNHFSAHAKAFYFIVGALIVTALLQSIFLWGKSWPEDQTELIIRGAAFMLVFVAFWIKPDFTQAFHFVLSLMVLAVLAYFIYLRAIAPTPSATLGETSSWLDFPAHVIASPGSSWSPPW